MALIREALRTRPWPAIWPIRPESPIWNAIPTKFNNAFPYQRDAMSGGTCTT